MTTKSIEQRFQKLSEVEHVLKRPGRYIGSIETHEAENWVTLEDKPGRMFKRPTAYNPGFLKIFDEVITNSSDHSKRSEGKHLNIIKVEVDKAKGTISVFDNGGIPVEMHKGENKYVPELIFELRAGSNFDDEDADKEFGSGQNGEGAGLTNIFSKRFTVETCDTKKQFKMVFEENSQKRNAPTIKDAKGEKGYTKITYEPDWKALKMPHGMTDDDYTMLYTRTVEVAACNTHIKVYFNGVRIFPIPNHSFKDYIEMFGDGSEEFEYAYEETEHYRVGVAASLEGFEHLSFVNTTRTRQGGNHIHYVGMQIWEALRAHINKKHKVDVPPAQLRQHIMLFLDCAISNPRYDSQTKENLITESKDFKTTYTPSEKFIKRIINSGVIQNILDAAAAKAEMERMRALRGAQKDMDKTDYRRVEKFTDANEKKDRKNCVCFFSEGDSASKAVQSGRGKNSRYLGSFPLRGKPLNVRDKEVERVLGIKKKKKDDDDKKKSKPSILQCIMTIMGLRIGEKVESVDQLNFGKVAFTTDADVDGAHISGLLINFFDHFWPELFELGVVHIFRTPLVKVFHKGKTIQQFFTEREFRDWEAKDGQKLKGWTKKYYKGLGTSSTKEFVEYFENMEQYLFRLDMKSQEDKDAIDLAFNGQRADDRKDWLETPPANFEDFVVMAEKLEAANDSKAKKKA